MYVVRKMDGLIIGCMAVMICLFSIVFVDYIQSTQDSKYVEWDVKTITAGDYSAEFEITPEFYEEFLHTYYDERNPIPETM